MVPIGAKGPCILESSCALQSRGALDIAQRGDPNMYCTRRARLGGRRSHNLLGPSDAESKRKANEQYCILCIGVELVC